MTGYPPSEIFHLFYYRRGGDPEAAQARLHPYPSFCSRGLYRAVVARCAPTNLHKRANGKGRKIKK